MMSAPPDVDKEAWSAYQTYVENIRKYSRTCGYTYHLIPFAEYYRLWCDDRYNKSLRKEK